MKKISFILLLLISSISVFADKHDLVNRPNIDSTWENDTTLQGVSFFYKMTTCVNEDAILLAIENTNNSMIAFSWTEDVWIDGAMTSLSSYKTYTLSAAERKAGSCENSNLAILEIKLTDISSTGNHITGFHFNNIHILL
jgi:hypothetical protein